VTNFILIAVCIIAGILFRRYGKLPGDAHKSINAWIIYLALPAVSFKYLPHIQWSSELLWPVLGPIIIWLGAWTYCRVYAHIHKIPKNTEGGLKLSTGLANTSFVGFPLVIAYFSEKELSIAVICDQVTFMLLATAGIIVAIHSSKKQRLTPAVVAKRLFRFPPFIAFVLASVLPSFVDLAPLEPLFDKLALTVGPLALFSIGLQLNFNGWRGELKLISFALLYKLFLAPLLVLLVLVALGVKGIIAQVTLFEAAMPTLLTSGIVADEYGLNSRVSNLIIGIGIVLSFASTAFWWWVMRSIL
jgi:predicted permease